MAIHIVLGGEFMKMKRLLFILLAAALCLTLSPALALSEDGEGDDGAGNRFRAGGDAANLSVALDLYAAGQNVVMSNTTVGAAALLAGQNISVSDSRVGGSIRAAGYNVSLLSCQVSGNLTLAGYSVRVGSGVTAQGVYAAASNIVFSGQCRSLTACGATVTLSGKVAGDAHIYADKIILAPGAEILGTLYAHSAQAPEAVQGTTVGSIEFTQTQQDNGQLEQALSSPLLSKLKRMALTLPTRIVLALALYLAFRRQIKQTAEMALGRPVSMPISGLVALLCVPMASIVLMITVVGLPAGLLLSGLYALILSFSLTFAACAAARLAFPKMHPLVACIVGASIATVAKAIPVLGIVVTLVSMVYSLGYFVQEVYLGLKDGGGQNAPASPAAMPGTSQQNPPQA